MGPRYFPGRTVLFKREANGVTFRIPALLYIPSSTTFLAFSEERLSPSDAEANLLVLRRGTFYRNYVEWEDMRALYPAYLKNHRSMNPCPVFDEFTGTVFLFFIAVLGNIPESFQLITGKNVTRLCYISSTDHGRTWSPVTDLTDRTIGDSIKEWATFALGPGHGIQLKSGRLLIPAYAYHIDCKECFGKICTTTPHSFTFYSDSHGKSWRFGEFVPNLETVECQLVSVDEDDGTNTLYCNSRSPLGYRVQALSKDDGAVFLEGQLVQKLVEQPHGCHGSVNGTLPLPGTNFLPPTWVIYSHPTSPDTRVQLGIYLSTFPRDPDSWSEPWVIYEGPSAYSDLAYVKLPSTEAAHNDTPAVAFACLFENGSKSPYEEISFSIFTLSELIHNIPKKSDLSHNTLKSTKLRNHCTVA
ncbi:NEUR4 protein, partial [Polyodon spathula]|nr:NEUR4 protein [Polyodon spathula]